MIVEIEGDKPLEEEAFTLPEEVSRSDPNEGKWESEQGEHDLIYSENNVIYLIYLLLQKLEPADVMAQKVIGELERTQGYEHVAVLLLDRAGGRLRPLALSLEEGLKDPVMAARKYADTHDLRLGKGIAGMAAQAGKAIHIGESQKSHIFSEVSGDIQSQLCVPMRVGGRVVGVICVESSKPNAYNQSDSILLETVSGLLALAIQNDHLSSRIGRGSDVMSNPPLTGPADMNDIISQLRSEIQHRAEVESAAQIRTEELAKLNAALKNQNEELNAFSHTVAHDLKNPLSILLGFAELLEQDYGGLEDQLLKQGVEVILENGRRMANIIDELLLMAEVRQLDEIKMQPLDMARVVIETQERLSNFIKEYRATLIVPSAWPTAMGHRAWVQEVWVNYVSNAIKHGGRPPKVELGAMVQRDGMIRFWVRDNGQGIKQEDQKRLFSPFTKLERTRAQGHGLGLSIVQRIVSKLGGQVGVQSKPGRGSLFWFTLPIARESEEVKEK